MLIAAAMAPRAWTRPQLDSEVPPLLYRWELVHLAHFGVQLLPQGEGEPVAQPGLLLRTKAVVSPSVQLCTLSALGAHRGSPS